MQQCGARDATQRLRPAARCGIRITVLISIHSLVAFATAHRKNTIQITCRYMAALLESCTESGAQDRGNYHGKCCFVIRSAKITAQDSALHSIGPCTDTRSDADLMQNDADCICIALMQISASLLSRCRKVTKTSEICIVLSASYSASYLHRNRCRRDADCDHCDAESLGICIVLHRIV